MVFSRRDRHDDGLDFLLFHRNCLFLQPADGTRQRIGCFHTGRSAGRYRAFPFAGRFLVSMDRCWEAIGESRGHDAVIPFAVTAASSAFSGNEAGQHSGRMPVRKHLRQFFWTWKCRHTHGHPVGAANERNCTTQHCHRRNVSVHRLEYFLHPADSRHRGRGADIPWLQQSLRYSPSGLDYQYLLRRSGNGSGIPIGKGMEP